MPDSISESPSPFGSKAVSKLATERLQEMSNCAKLAKMPLQEGAMMWLQSRKPFIGARTARDYEKYICIIVRFFGNVRLEKLANSATDEQLCCSSRNRPNDAFAGAA